MELKKNKCFVAYSSNSPSLSETLENAIEKIQLGQCVDVQSWKSLSVSGKYIIIEICKAIDACEIFICDLTTLNHNVLFELGFAIAKNKRVWILLDPNSIDSISNYKKFKILTTI